LEFELIVRSARTRRGFTLIELLIVIVLIGVMSGMAVLAMGQDDSGRHPQLEAERLARLLELAEQETSVRGEVMAVEIYTHGYRFLQADGADWQVVTDDDLFQARSVAAPLHLALILDGETKPLTTDPGYKPQPQIVLTAEGGSQNFRIGIGDADNTSRYWVDNGDDGFRVVAAEALPR